MFGAGDAFQCSNFLFLHGYYRAALAELRVAWELVMIGAYGNLKPDDPDYVVWKISGSELGFTRFRKHMYAGLRSEQCKWVVADEEFLDKTFRQLCNFTHSRSNSTDGALWESNGPCVCARSGDADVLYDGIRLRDLLSSHSNRRRIQLCPTA